MRETDRIFSRVSGAGISPASRSDTTNTGNVLAFTYGFSYSVANNGNVASIANNKNTARAQSFTYDELNCIKTAQSQATSGGDCWGLQFGYDVWANLLSASTTKCAPPALNVGVSTKNQITNTNFQYDAAGNLTFDGSLSVTYDGENRITTTNAGATYTYDGDGKRGHPERRIDVCARLAGLGSCRPAGGGLRVIDAFVRAPTPSRSAVPLPYSISHPSLGC